MNLLTRSKQNCFGFVILFCLSFLQSAPSFATVRWCTDVFTPTVYHESLVRAYEYFIETVNKDTETLPKQIVFKGNTYKVVHYLGAGLDGLVARVEDPSGKVTIMKTFHRNFVRGFLRQIWGYYKMNKNAENPYTVIAVDYKNRIFQFKDIRGIPMNMIGDILFEAGAPDSLMKYIWGKVAMVGLRYYEQNEVYDIDRDVFVSIDPH